MMSLQKLPDLRILDVAGCWKMGDYGVLHISEIETLEKLNLSSLNITSYGFMLCAVLPRLRVLNVHRCGKLRDNAMVHVIRFPRLQVSLKRSYEIQ